MTEHWDLLEQEEEADRDRPVGDGTTTWDAIVRPLPEAVGRALKKAVADADLYQFRSNILHDLVEAIAPAVEKLHVEAYARGYEAGQEDATRG